MTHSTAQHSTAQHSHLIVNSKKEHLAKAKKEKNDEFYTQYFTIEKEINAYLDFDENAFRGKTVLLPCDDPEWSNFTKYFAQNFTRLGLKKLISTSYSQDGKGKLFSITRDVNHDGVIDLRDLEWEYLEGNGDFRNEEIKILRDEADIIVTNPPFSLFREFLAWIISKHKKFLIIGNMNAITYKEVFPLIKENKLWLGTSFGSIEYKEPNGTFKKMGNTCWFTNLEHGRRHEPLKLMTMADNLKYNKKVIKEPNSYQKYDNYDAIEVPFTNAIPSDYDGVMGVPISFLEKYNPEQFEILGITQNWSGNASKIYPSQIQVDKNMRETKTTALNGGPALKIRDPNKGTFYIVDGEYYIKAYARILIRHKK